ncbi:MAG TPA: hypothetical protein VM076_09915, partial [Gemmatimonadaceae bacterium]|nr:hypothetical protein [Gemmatimonadaceae bacterium]
MPQPLPHSSPSIAGSVLPIKRAEELLATLPGVIAARIIASDNGAVDEIHVLTTSEVTPKQTVRNIESALIAHLGMRVDHRKISVATTLEAQPSKEVKEAAREKEREREAKVVAEATAAAVAAQTAQLPVKLERANGRLLYFEDVEVRRSRAKGIACRVTLKKGEETFVGEAEGMENERSRIELAARAALQALAQAEPSDRALALDGVRLIEAFDREFVFVGVTARFARTSALLTGSCEIRESAETASVLAVLDATNR